MLDQKLAQLMQRILEQNAASTPLGATSRRLQEDLRLGLIRGKTLHLTDMDRSEMRILLAARGYSLTPVALGGLSRSERLAAGTPNEKAGGGSIKSGRISIKALAGQSLNIGDRSLSLPIRCHLDAEWHAIVDKTQHDGIMLVENYEVFNFIDELVFDLPSSHANPIVIYRGDKNESRQDNVKAFLEASLLPVMAFVDIDPKGLQIAGNCPRLLGIIAPDRIYLEKALASPSTARPDLFQKQLPGVQEYLRSFSLESSIFHLWNLLQNTRSAAVQERWLADHITCTLWTGNKKPPTS